MIHLLETRPHKDLRLHFTALFQAFLQTINKYVKKCKNSWTGSK